MGWNVCTGNYFTGDVIAPSEICTFNQAWRETIAHTMHLRNCAIKWLCQSSAVASFGRLAIVVRKASRLAYALVGAHNANDCFRIDYQWVAVIIRGQFEIQTNWRLFVGSIAVENALVFSRKSSIVMTFWGWMGNGDSSRQHGIITPTTILWGFNAF